VKARPPTFVAFVSGKTNLSDTDIGFLTKSLKARSKRNNLVALENLDEEFPRKATLFNIRSKVVL
jgi:hypothetical protein